MGSFLYFAPNVTQTPTMQLARELGLGYAFTSSPTGTVCSINTPDGGTGVVFGDEKRLGDFQPVMNLDEQEWTKSADRDCYIGYWKASPPTPDDLARPFQLPGYTVKIGGFEWQIPVTAKFDDQSQSLATMLPCALKYAGNGKWTKGDVLKIHRQLWAIGQPFRDDFIDHYVHAKPSRVFSDDEIGEALYHHLHANYVVGRDELSILEVGSQNDPGVAAAIMVANDVLTLDAWAEQKKSTVSPAIADGLNIVDGEAT